MAIRSATKWQISEILYLASIIQNRPISYLREVTCSRSLDPTRRLTRRTANRAIHELERELDRPR